MQKAISFSRLSSLPRQPLIMGLMLALALVAVLAPEVALAGTGGTEFDTVWATLKGWMQGTLGRIAAGAMILVGLIGGVARQSIMAFAVGVGGGIGLYNTPTVIEAMMTATLEAAPGAVEAVVTISNGLGF